MIPWQYSCGRELMLYEIRVLNKVGRINNFTQLILQTHSFFDYATLYFTVLAFTI